MASFITVVFMSVLQIVVLTALIENSPYVLLGKDFLDGMCSYQKEPLTEFTRLATTQRRGYDNSDHHSTQPRGYDNSDHLTTQPRGYDNSDHLTTQPRGYDNSDHHTTSRCENCHQPAPVSKLEIPLLVKPKLRINKHHIIAEEFCAGRALHYIFIFSCIVVSIVNSMPYLNMEVPVKFMSGIVTLSLKRVYTDEKGNIQKYSDVIENF